MEMASSAALAASNPAYTRQARILHWITAILVLGLIPVGISLDKLPDGSLKDTMFDLHRATGVVVMLLTLWRLLHRVNNPPRPHGADLPAIQRIVSKIVHFALYAMLILSPIIGWVGASVYGASLNFFWLFEIPSPFTANVPLAEKILGLHSVLGISMAAALLLHIGAALYHHYIRKDQVFRRMTGRA